MASPPSLLAPLGAGPDDGAPPRPSGRAKLAESAPRDPSRSGEVQGDPLQLAVNQRHLIGEASRVDPALPAIHAVAGGFDPLLRSHPLQFGDEAVDRALGLGFS